MSQYSSKLQSAIKSAPGPDAVLLATDPKPQIFHGILGAFLLVAAGLKAYSLALGALPLDSFLSSQRIQIAAIEMEVLLGLWLLSGYKKQAASTIAFAFFGALSGLALYLAMTGQESCGCFGHIRVSPWITLGLDAAILMGLVFWRPKAQKGVETIEGTFLPEFQKTALWTIGLLVIFSGIFWLGFKNPSAVLAKLRGESISVNPAESQVGDGIVGEQRIFPIHLRNNTLKSIRVIGGTTTCGCVSTDNLPVTFAPGEIVPVNVRIIFRGSMGRFGHYYALYTDNEEEKLVVARFVGRVIGFPDK